VRQALVQVRPYQESDLAAVVEAFTRSVHELGHGHYDSAQLAAWAPSNPDLDRWRLHFRSIETLVAEEGGRVAGFIGHGPVGHVDVLYVHPSFARRGIATRLLDAVERLAIQAGERRLHTESSLAARAFFEACGFVVVEEEVVQTRGQPLLRFRMTKELAGLA
jgi:putative acetyltransferase